MLRIALKNLMARKGRLLMSAIGVIASCAFLAGVFVFGDTITGSFNRTFANAYRNTSAFVRSSNSIKAEFGSDTRDTVDESLIATLKALPNITDVAGVVSGQAQLSTMDDKAIGIDGPPKFGGAWDPTPISPWSISDGKAPNAADEVVIDRHSAKFASLKVGDKVQVTTTVGTRTFKIVGIATFAGNDTTGGATWGLFTLPVAQEFVDGRAGTLNGVVVRSDGSVSDEELKASIQKAVSGQKIEVLTRAEITAETQSALQKGIGSFTTFLTIFAGIAVFVGCFIIYNVFKITTAQRLRENALLRAIGARSGQVVRAQLIEAFVIGVVGGVLGFLAGLGLATLILGILGAIGFAPSDTRLTVNPSSFVITLIVGVVVTLVCAVAPALRAGRVPPLAALRDVSIDRTSHSRRRLWVGVASVVISAIGVALGLTSSTTWLVPGVAGLFVAMVAFGPAVVRPISLGLVKPLRRLRGVTGEIAARNAARSPERTALTASALAICLALLIGVSSLGSSIVASLRHTVAEQFNGDVAITASGNGRSGGLPPTVLSAVQKLPQVEAALAVGFSALRDESPSAAGSNKALVVMTVNPEGADRLVKITFVTGGWADLSGDKVLISKKKATSDGLQVGDTIPASFLSGQKVTLTVAGVFDSKILGDVVTDRTLLEQSGSPMFDLQVLALAKSGVTDQALKSAVKPITDLVPIAKVQTRSEFIDSQVSTVQGFLNFIYALLGMSVFIAVLGIVLTLLLSVYERRRELGLVRAIGMTRRQVRSSVRWESIVTAIIGAVLGVLLGVALGWIVVKALVDQGLNTFAVSVPTIAVFTIAAMLFAVVAAWLPSRRAAKADILQAIATT